MNDRFPKSEAFLADHVWDSLHNQNDRNYRRVLKKLRAKAVKRNGAK